ncbi:MAG: glycosyltransferase family 39 protein [Anaerolineae bacterium]|nr:glycosyltransferase family 39 protein [Anaerolineae bacterium]
MDNTSNNLRFALALIVVALLLCAMFGLSVGSSLEKSPTFDEGQYIGRGWLYLHAGSRANLLSLGHPPLTSELIGLGLLLEPDLPKPAALNGWEEGNIELMSEDLLWQRGLNVDRIVFLSRMPIIFLGLLLGVIVWRWGREMYGLWSASVALGLVAFSPTVIAHTRLATTDMGVTVFYVATLYAWSRFLRRRTVYWLIISGLVFGLAQASKFSALILVPTLGVMTLWIAWQKRGLALRQGGRLASYFDQLGKKPFGWLLQALASLLVMGLIGALVVWGCDRFTMRPLDPGYYLGELQHFLSLASEGHRAYLVGRFSQGGWWYYHPFTLLVKLTLPELLILLAAITAVIIRGIHQAEWELLFPTLIYLAVSMSGSLNVGIRYLLPILPLLFIFAARKGLGIRRPIRVRLVLSGVLVICQAVVSVLTYPDYLAFFNVAAGGSDNGYHLLADSNLDWGQDLPGLAKYMQERDIGQIYLSYFGHSDPAYYGINAIALPGWPPDRGGPVFYPMNPQPGFYAISASNLVGVQLLDQDTFGYFRAREPIASIGHSILIYEVPPAGSQSLTWAGQCSIPEPTESQETLIERTGIPELRHFYFDCLRSLPFQPGPGWLVMPPGAQPLVDLGDPDYLARFPDGSLRYRVWQVDGAPPAPSSKVDFPDAPLPIPIAGYLELLGYEVAPVDIPVGKTLVLTGWWRVRELPPLNISIFAHLLAPDGRAVQVGDALSVRPEDWLPGMVFIQQHILAVDENILPGDYSVAVGLYSLSTGERFVISEMGDRLVDHIVLRSVRVIPSGQ